MYVLISSVSGESQEHILDAFNILEKSNIMIYISYHLHKEYAHYLRVNIFSEFCQLLIYSYYRLFVLSLYIYDNRTQFFRFRYITQFLIIVLYCMGYAWSYRLLRKNRTNFYALKERNNDWRTKYSSAGWRSAPAPDLHSISRTTPRKVSASAIRIYASMSERVGFALAGMSSTITWLCGWWGFM